MQDLTLYAIPFFVVTIALEAAASRRRSGIRGYETRDTFASLAMGVGNRIIYAAATGLTIGLLFWLWSHRFHDLGTAWWVWVLLFFAEDLTYYVFHRASHEVRFLWAAHENHHSSQHYNLSTALRQSWTTPFTDLLFYWWMPLAGFHPTMILIAKTWSLIYQYWIHTELIDRIGIFERVLNTPSHHRVHHGANVEYLDRNHAGILIVWDKLFGTFEPERAPVRYGLTKNISTFNPMRIAFHEWYAMFRDVVAARNWKQRLGYVFMPPGWSPDGSRLTSRQLRAAAARSAAVAPLAGA
jgi:sterol desaturase/sphingolipid hydroxylase (fatty acid hydroxylase superfamily)